MNVVHSRYCSILPFHAALSRQKRTAATHLFVVMISPEERQKKPYALPIQCIPYTGLTEKVARNIVNEVLKEMRDRGMQATGNYACSLFTFQRLTISRFPTGFVSNGEYNSMRVKGYTRPLSVLKIRSDSRAKYSSMGKKMLAMLSPICK